MSQKSGIVLPFSRTSDGCSVTRLNSRGHRGVRAAVRRVALPQVQDGKPASHRHVAGRGKTLGAPQVGFGASSDHVLRTVIQAIVTPGANVKCYKITCSESYVFVSPPVLSAWRPPHRRRPQMLAAHRASSRRRGIVTPSAALPPAAPGASCAQCGLGLFAPAWERPAPAQKCAQYSAGPTQSSQHRKQPSGLHLLPQVQIFVK